MKIRLNNLKDTEKLGKTIANCLVRASVICLDGDLGVGKTALTQFIAKELGVKDYVVSPTFTIIKEYEGKFPLYHMDVYRVNSEDEMYDLGYEEYIYSEGITIIEWSNLIKDILPQEKINIEIKRIDDTKREIYIHGKGPAFECLIEELNNENTFN